jgi:hypothetical protein
VDYRCKAKTPNFATPSKNSAPKNSCLLEACLLNSSISHDDYSHGKEVRRRHMVPLEDLAIAQAIYQGLSEGLEVFFPRNQEELAGTNGLESMREPYARDSKVERSPLPRSTGQYALDRVEAAAVQEACLQNHFEGIFSFMVDATSTPPKWLPRTHVRPTSRTSHSSKRSVQSKLA